jgi:hypothetical protein
MGFRRSCCACTTRGRAGCRRVQSRCLPGVQPCAACALPITFLLLKTQLCWLVSIGLKRLTLLLGLRGYAVVPRALPAFFLLLSTAAPRCFQMHVLRRSAHAVLWLYVRDTVAQANLQLSAKAAGVHPSRLIFMAKTPKVRWLHFPRPASLFYSSAFAGISLDSALCS